MDAKGTDQILWHLHPTNSTKSQQQLCCFQKEQLHHLPSMNRTDSTQPTAAAALGEQQQL